MHLLRMTMLPAGKVGAAAAREPAVRKPRGRATAALSEYHTFATRRCWPIFRRTLVSMLGWL
jgi:hypothetical protein